MIRNRAIAMVLAFGLLALTVRSEPAAVDASTPRAALNAFLQSVRTGDLETAKSLVARTDAQKRLEAMVASVNASVLLEKAAIEKFGAATKIVDLPSAEQIKAQTDQLQETGSSDLAKLVPPVKPNLVHPERRPIEPVGFTLKKIDGKWKVDLSEPGPLSYGIEAEDIARCEGWTAVDTALLAELQAGKFQTAGALKEARKLRLRQSNEAFLAPGKFIGVPAEGGRIVFICDATGSMMSKFDLLRVELHKAVEALHPWQKFNLVFFQENPKPPLENQLLTATDEHKRRIFDYIDNYAARGPTDALPSIKLALKMKPDVVYLLIDPSDFPDKPAILELFRQANADKKMKVHTIAFIDKDPEDEKFLKQLASENGGVFKYVSEDDLGK